MSGAAVRRLRRLGRAEAGSALVEYAFVLPILLGLTFFIVQLGGMAMTQATLTYAVQQAARCAAIGACKGPPDITRYAAQVAGLGTNASNFHVDDSGCPQHIWASFTGSYFAAPFLPAPPPIRAEICAS